MTLSEKMYGLLSGSTTLTSLTGTRIYPISLPQDPRFPAVRYAIISSVRDHAMTQDTGGVHARVQITSWGRTPDEAENVSEGVRASVQRLPGTTDGFECFLENEFVDFDSDAGVYAHNLDVTVHYQE